MTASLGPMVLVEPHGGGVVEVALNCSETLNALSVALVQALRGAVRAACELRPTAVVVTSRCDRAFSVGADLKERSAMTRDDLLACRPDFIAAYRSLLELPVPVVAGIHGFAVGGGLELALTCDLIVADSTSVVALPEVRIGLIPGGGGSQLLGRRTGWGPAADLVLTGRRVLADEALRLGIVDRVVPEGEARTRAIELATAIASSSPTSLAWAKQALRDGWSQPLDEALAFEDGLWRQAATSQDREEGIRAFIDKRPPVWGGHG